MLLVSIIVLFSILALGLLALLDRYDSAMLRAQAHRQASQQPKLVYYDAFADRRHQPKGTIPKGQSERRPVAG